MFCSCQGALWQRCVWCHTLNGHHSLGVPPPLSNEFYCFTLNVFPFRIINQALCTHDDVILQSATRLIEFSVVINILLILGQTIFNKFITIFGFIHINEHCGIHVGCLTLKQGHTRLIIIKSVSFSFIISNYSMQVRL